jgi:membrane protease subunit HflK
MSDNHNNRDKSLEPHDIGDPELHLPQSEDMDAASRSLTEALKISFSVLKIIMVVLVVLFFASGVFKVDQDSEAIVLHFGKIRGDIEDKVLGPGLHFAWPEPIDKIIKIPVKQVQGLSIDMFWYYQTEKEKLSGSKGRPGKTLNPLRDGYTLTRNEPVEGLKGNDYNIVHSKWELSYRISSPEDFFRNIYYNDPRPGEAFLEAVSATVDPMLNSMAGDSIVTTMVNYSIDEAIVSAPEIAQEAKRRLQDKLDTIESGISIVAMQVTGRITWPRQVDDAFEASNRASQEAQRMVAESKGYADRVLSEAGGPNAEEVLIGLKKEGVTEEERLYYLSLLSGEAREIISRARAYRTKVVEDARANAEYMKALLPEFEKRPRLVIEKIHQDAVEDVLNNVDEKLFIHPVSGDEKRELRIHLSRDPELVRRRANQANEQ